MRDPRDLRHRGRRRPAGGRPSPTPWPTAGRTRPASGTAPTTPSGCGSVTGGQSIIDLSAAASQPFVKDGLVLVFYGEIYNYRELRAELAGAGTGFRTSSDSEVLLEAWCR